MIIAIVIFIAMNISIIICMMRSVVMMVCYY